MASRYYETKEVTLSVIPRAKVPKTDLGLLLVYQGDSHPESQYAPSLLRKFMLLLKSAALREKQKHTSTRTLLANTLASAYGKHELTVYHIFLCLVYLYLMYFISFVSMYR
jgi:hypothetical protein